MNTDVVKLGEITSITKLAGFEFTKYFNYNQTGEIIALRALNLRNGKLDLTDIHRIDKSISDKLPRSKLYKGDILFTYTGNGYGDCALVDEDDKYHLAPNICKITSNQEKVDYTFLFYTIRSKSFYGQVSGFIGGSGQPTIPMERIRKLKIFLPKMQVQQKIANILSRYDEAIENNNKRIKLLEQMAQNLYKEWFVRFRFPGWENCEFENGIPVGWRIEKLGNVVKDVGKTISKSDIDLENDVYIPIDCIPNHNMALQEVSDIENAESSLQHFNSGDILFGAMRVYFHKVIIAPMQGVTRKTCFVINAKNPILKYYLYLLLYQDSTIDYASTISVGATMPYVRWNDFMRMKCLIPNNDLILKFNHIIEPIMKKILSSYNYVQNLSKQRDLLLPRLMSGKLEVK